MRAQELMDAFESLDADLLYAAHAEPQPKRRLDRRFLIAAAIVIMLIGTAVVYGIFVAPSAWIYLESRDDTTIILNSRGIVLSATDHPDLSGKTAQEAVGTITRDMLRSGALSNAENTLILGTEKMTEQTQERLLETVQSIFTESRFHGAIICLPCSDAGAKSAVIDLLLECDPTLSRNSLRRLSANDLNLLLHTYRTVGAKLIGKPTEHTVIPKTATIEKPDDSKSTQPPSERATQENTDPVTSHTDGASYIVSDILQTVVSGNDAQLSTSFPKYDSVIATEFAITPVSSAAPTTAPFEKAADPAVVTEPPTSSPTEAIQIKSRYADIPCDAQTKIFDMTIDDFASEDDSFGEAIPFTPLENYSWRMDWHETNYKKSEIAEMGKQDRRISLYCSREDFIHDAFSRLGDDYALGEYLSRLADTYGIDADFFSENALLLLTYYDSIVYKNEEDTICSLRQKDDTLLVDLLRKNAVTGGENDLYKAVIPVIVKKDDVKDITDFRLYLTKQQ